MLRNLTFLVIVAAAMVMVFPGALLAQQAINSVKVTQAPAIDGKAGDKAWSSAAQYIIKDIRLAEDIKLKTVHTGDSIYFMVSFPDSAEDRLHKPWVWNKDLEAYQIGPQREDTFAFKWSMSGNNVDLSNFSDDDYKADVWYWKANRTDPAGFSDDKSHFLGSEEAKKSKHLSSKTGKSRYLVRKGDSGAAAQKKVLLTDYQGDVKEQYMSQQPDGSHADIKARGVWQDGTWTIEFARKLDTGNPDDIKFETGGKYLFGVSITGLYGEKIDKAKAHPYGQGRISEPLFLTFN
jgi:hypothetical protein